MKRQKRLRFQLNEKQLGYAMVIPSLILIIAVVLWPVAQSFYNSMFDYRLNDPARSQRMLSATIDLERYVDNYFYIDGQLETLAGGTDSNKTKDTIADIREGVDTHHSELIDDEDIKQKVEKIDELLASYTPVKNEDLKYAKLDNDFAAEYRQVLKSYQKDLTAIAESASDDETKQQFQQTADLLGATAGNILESNFVGLSNYKKYLQDARMWKSLWNTTFFTAVSVAFELVFGIGIA